MLSGPSSRRGRRRSTLAPRFAYSSGIPHACASSIAPTGNDSGSSTNSTIAAAQNGIVCAIVVTVHTRPRRSSERSSTRGRQ